MSRLCFIDLSEKEGRYDAGVRKVKSIFMFLVKRMVAGAKTCVLP